MWYNGSMAEIIFSVTEDPEGGFVAQAVGSSIVTQGDSMEELRENVRDAVRCHFDSDAERPRVIRLHRLVEEILAA